jgi:glycosyltransferase involved in cell wall biosynthesis
MLNFRRNIISYFAMEGFPVAVLAPLDKSCAEIQNVSYIDFGSADRSLSIFDLIHQVIILNRILKKEQIGTDVCIFVYSSKMILISILASFGLRCKVFPYFIGLGALFLKRRYFVVRVLLGRIIDLCGSVEGVVCLNNSDVHVLADYIKKKRIILMRGEGLDSSQFRFINANTFSALRFVIVSRPLIEKGVLLFVESVRYLRSIYGFNAEFAIYGFDESTSNSDLPGCFFEECRNLNISLYGYVNNIQDHIRVHDVLVLPSRREGMSRACMEMQQYGLPVIGSNVPGISDIVINGVTGFLVDEPHPRYFADAMKIFCLMSDDDFKNFRSRIARANKRYLSDFEVINFYLNLCDEDMR